MEKKIFIIQGFLIGLVCSVAFGQADFDKKLRSLYKNTVPLISDDVLITTIHKEKIILLDTRSSEEFNVSHLPNALFIDYESFRPDDVKSLDRNTKIVVYCSVGYRSERIGERLLKLGFKDVNNLYGGIFDWVNDGNKVINRSGITTDTVHTYNKEWSKWLQKGVKVY
jgi:rhodanese-related sulfurtransferase